MAVIDFSKALTGDTATMVFYAKRLLGGGETPFTKADLVDAIQARADATLSDGLSPQQRFSRAISGGDEVAMTLYRAMNAAPGSSVRAPIEKADSGPRHAGPASAKMHSLALDRQRSRAIPFSSAYYETYIHPDNKDLREQVKREELEHLLSRCLIPGFDGAFLSHETKDALWDKFCTAAPQRQRRSVERYNIVKRA